MNSLARPPHPPRTPWRVLPLAAAALWGVVELVALWRARWAGHTPR